MGYLDVHPHQHDYQGWLATVTAHGAGTPVHLGIEGFDDACDQARRHGVRLRVGAAAQAQIDRAGTGPREWPAEVVSAAGFRGWP